MKISYLDNEEKFPIRNSGMRFLDAKGDQTTKGASDSSKTEPIGHA